MSHIMTYVHLLSSGMVEIRKSENNISGKIWKMIFRERRCDDMARRLRLLEGEEALRLLVEQGITGSLVWLLFNDVCDRNPATAMQMLREGTAKAAVEERL